NAVSGIGDLRIISDGPEEPPANAKATGQPLDTRMHDASIGQTAAPNASSSTAHPTEAPMIMRVEDSSVDAGMDAGMDTASDTGSGVTSTIRCGAELCPVVPGSVCCLTASGPTCGTSATCKDATLSCDDTADCVALGLQGTICCGYN